MQGEMRDTVFEEGMFDFKVDRDKKEEMHLILVADYGEGYFTLYSKRLPDGDIFYKMTYQEGEYDETLHEGEVNPTDFNKFVEDYQEDVLIPAGSAWREIKPYALPVNDVVQELH